ncbi:hypothetical protein [Flavonifractor plautii]|jgi:hypothetical protein|uniref:hypothetical protein n=1 Tax=Flavonifractor plautii TaxID=292800 RepID=UPI001A9B50C4|nr:hypothetical protein [Flavonifractor plautii]
MTEQYVGFGYQATELELPFRTASPKGRRTEVQFSFLHQAQKLRPMCFLLSEKNIYLPI